jgi:hypothetical protein
MASRKDHDLAPAGLVRVRQDERNVLRSDKTLCCEIFLKRAVNEINSVDDGLAQQSGPLEEILYNPLFPTGELRQLIRDYALGLSTRSVGAIIAD